MIYSVAGERLLRIAIYILISLTKKITLTDVDRLVKDYNESVADVM